MESAMDRGAPNFGEPKLSSARGEAIKRNEALSRLLVTNIDLLTMVNGIICETPVVTSNDVLSFREAMFEIVMHRGAGDKRSIFDDTVSEEDLNYTPRLVASIESRVVDLMDTATKLLELVAAYEGRVAWIHSYSSPSPGCPLSRSDFEKAPDGGEDPEEYQTLLD